LSKIGFKYFEINVVELIGIDTGID